MTRPDRSPIACDLFALTPDERTRRARLAGLLRDTVAGIGDLPSGYSVHLRPEMARPDVDEFISLERRCCPFLSFDIRTGGTGEVLVLDITGPEGVKTFLAQQFGLSSEASGPEGRP